MKNKNITMEYFMKQRYRATYQDCLKGETKETCGLCSS